MPPGAVVSPADLVGAVPLTFLTATGELRFDAGRLRFTDSRGVARLDAPIEELHSITRSAMGMHAWHGDRRYRFAFFRASRDRRKPQEAKRLADSWVTLLTPLSGEPPAGVLVRRPWPVWAWVLVISSLLLGILLLAAVLIQARS